jgi:hypothetical protein
VLQIPESLQARSARLAAQVAIGRHAAAVAEAVALACDLVVADVVTKAVLEVAALNEKETWRDSRESVLEMLEELRYALAKIDDEAAAWPVLLRAFGFWDLPVGEFYGPFLHRLPAWDGQDPLDRSLTLLLDEFDHADAPARETIVARMRAAVRAWIG